MTQKDDQSKDQLFKRVLDVLEQIRPSIKLDGGDIELVDVSVNGVVSIRFLGACVGCPSLDVTLQNGIESRLKDRIEGITRVKAVE